MNMFQQLAQMQFNWKVGNYDPNEVGIFFAALCFITSYLFSGANPYVPMSYRLNTIVVSSVMVGVMSGGITYYNNCLLYTSPSPRDGLLSRMPSSA